ncbi:unnamed protein product [Onchocerca ochengi]|uniref:Conserved plasma membrane protein n=1 Tax=Onchocerca ochengi TaxID=42157 RepID=A0A182E452_ONCOC|nr:unnamed protein product [Onchocerca ochengi]
MSRLISKCVEKEQDIDGPNMVLTSQAPVAEPVLLIWPHIIIAIFSVSAMVSLLMLCVSTHCCRNMKKKENPYGEIATTPTADVSTSVAVSRNRIDGSRFHHHSRLSCPNLSLHERSVHRLSAPLPHSSAVTKRALPKLPELSAQFENKNLGAVYSTVDHSTAVRANDSFLYGEGPANPTYESIDVDPLYSKLGNGGTSVKRYDYPIFTSENRPPIATDDVLYQSASHIYAGVSEDPYSSITSHTGGDTNYDVGYSHVRENMNTEPSRSYLANAQVESRTLDHLYSQIRREPSLNRTANSSTYRPLPSNEFAVEYISSGSDKTSREPSYRYITVRESVDAIRQRLNELNPSSNTHQSVIIDGCGPIREHYYSSIGGSDYETLQISATSTNQPSYDSQNVPSTSRVSHDEQPKTISSAVYICENMPPNPPKSPIPLRFTTINDDNDLQLSLSGTNMDKTINNSDNCSNISEKIRRLRTNFFDQELKLLKGLNGPSSTDLRFGQLLGTTDQHETSKCINSSDTNRNLDPEHYSDQTLGSQSSTNFDHTYAHLPKLTADRSHTHNARNIIRIMPFSTANRQKVMHQEKCKNIAQNSRPHSFHEASAFGTKQSVKEDITFQQEGSNEERQCFIPERHDRFGKQAENNSSTSFTGASEDVHNSIDVYSFRCSSSPRTYPANRSVTSLNKASNNAEEGMEAQSCSHPRSTIELSFEEGGMDGDRSVQTASLSFSHELIDENVQNNEDNNGVGTAIIDPS